MLATATAISPVLFERGIFYSIYTKLDILSNNVSIKPLFMNYNWGELGFKFRTECFAQIKVMVNDIRFRTILSN